MRLYAVIGIPNYTLNSLVNIQLNVYTMLTQWHQETTQVVLEIQEISRIRIVTINTGIDLKVQPAQNQRWTHTHTQHTWGFKETGQWRQENKQPLARPGKELGWRHQNGKRANYCRAERKYNYVSPKRGGSSKYPKIKWLEQCYTERNSSLR